MVFVSKPPINLFAGWWYLFDREYRREVRDEWTTLPAWLIVMQMAAGAASILFPLVVAGLMAFVFVSRHM